VRGRTGNGAGPSVNKSHMCGILARSQLAGEGLERGANKACVARAAEGQTYRFRPLFLWFVSFGGAKEMNKKIEKEKSILTHPPPSLTFAKKLR